METNMRDSGLFFFDFGRGGTSYPRQPNHPDPRPSIVPDYPQHVQEAPKPSPQARPQHTKRPQGRQPCRVESQLVGCHIRPAMAIYPHVTYHYDAATDMFTYDPEEKAASLVRMLEDGNDEDKDHEGRRYVQRAMAIRPHVGYSYDPAMRLYFYYPKNTAASMKRSDELQPLESTGTHKRQKHGPTSQGELKVIDLTGSDDETAPMTTDNNRARASFRAGIVPATELLVDVNAVKAISHHGARMLPDTCLPTRLAPNQSAAAYDLDRNEDIYASHVCGLPAAQSHATPSSSPNVPDPTRGSSVRSDFLGAQLVRLDGSLSGPAPYIPLCEEDNDGCMEPRLCPEQQALVDLILSGKNVFYTGSAGCGKSTVLKAFTRRLRNMGKKVNIIAPTGRAALQVNGSTTWTYAGWTPDSLKKPLVDLRQNASGKQVWRRLNKTDVLVIDEVSMVENHFLERLNEIMKAARHKARYHTQPAFGGVQVVVTGDFCQLPPVKPFQYCIECGTRLHPNTAPGGRTTYTCKKHGAVYRDEDKWAFRSNAWAESKFVHFELKQIHRQSDELFIGILQKCRIGQQLSEEDIDILMDHDISGIEDATEIHALRAQVAKVNKVQFDLLKTECYTYHALDFFSKRSNLAANHAWKGRPKARARDSRWPASMPPLEGLKDHRFDECVDLKQGMLVVLLVNLDLKAGLCNGSQGTICGWEEHDPAKLPVADKDAEPSKRVTGDRAEMKAHLMREFIDAQPTEHRIRDVRFFEKKKVWPRVRFHNGLTRTIYAECSITELGDDEPYSLLARTQIPLAPAWAMTIHKAQGMTMDKVVVDVSAAFEEGQVYVALSRARSLDGLKIKGGASGLRLGLGGNKEVRQFFRENFPSEDMGDELRSEGSDAGTPTSSAVGSTPDVEELMRASSISSF